MYETYKNLVYRISVIYLGNTFDAEDLVQNVLYHITSDFPNLKVRSMHATGLQGLQ